MRQIQMCFKIGVMFFKNCVCRDWFKCKGIECENIQFGKWIWKKIWYYMFGEIQFYIEMFVIVGQQWFGLNLGIYYWCVVYIVYIGGCVGDFVLVNVIVGYNQMLVGYVWYYFYDWVLLLVNGGSGYGILYLMIVVEYGIYYCGGVLQVEMYLGVFYWL